VRLRLQLLLASVGVLLVILAVVNQCAGAWNQTGLELAGVCVYAAGFWFVSGFLIAGIEKLPRQTSEVVSGARPVLAIRSTSVEMKALLANLDEILLRLQSGKKQMHQFLGDASHELRTPLTVISAYLELLEQPDAQKNTEYVNKSVGKMAVEAKRMQRLIEDLLKLAEVGEAAPLGQTVPVDLASLVRFEVESLQDLQPDRKVTAKLGGPVMVQGNQDLLAQLLSNLFGNLRRHTPQSAEVEVEIVTGTTWVTLTCNDAGPGLTNAAYEVGIQHFQRYVQDRSRETGGSGLGMSIMASIVERHGGQMAISRSSLGGLCTRITLPV
jgi:two-component system, OmpR family, sensor kinase